MDETEDAIAAKWNWMMNWCAERKLPPGKNINWRTAEAAWVHSQILNRKPGENISRNCTEEIP